MTTHRKTIAQLAVDMIATAIWTEPDTAGWVYAKLPESRREWMFRAIERLLVEYMTSRTPFEELATAAIDVLHTEPTVGDVLSKGAHAAVVRQLEEWAPTMHPHTTSAELIAARKASSCL